MRERSAFRATNAERAVVVAVVGAAVAAAVAAVVVVVVAVVVVAVAEAELVPPAQRPAMLVSACLPTPSAATTARAVTVT